MQKNISVVDILSNHTDEEYKNFHSKLIPNIDKNRILGVRIPQIRKLAKELQYKPVYEEFIGCLPHFYYEEDNLHAFLIERIKDIDIAMKETERFLPFINNWATCDSFFPEIFRKYPELLAEKSIEWMKSEHCYTKRYGIGIFMKMFLDERFDIKYPQMISEIRSDEYYVNMMIAWYFATALTKRYDECICFIESNKLDKWVHNKTISKCCDSFRISQEKKEYLKMLRLI